MIIVAGGAHCADIVAIAHRAGIHNITIYDDNPETGIATPPADIYGPLMVGINDPAARREIAERYPHARAAAPVIDPSAIVGPDCHLGSGVVIAAQSALICSVSLGNHTHVGYHVGMTRTKLGDYSTVSPGVTICGNVEIGNEVWIGAGATICDRVRIGDGAIIGAGTLVLPESDVPDGTRVVGIVKP